MSMPHVQRLADVSQLESPHPLSPLSFLLDHSLLASAKRWTFSRRTTHKGIPDPAAPWWRQNGTAQEEDI
jgi:hypothetical protein